MVNIKLYPAKSEKVRWIERKEGIIILNAKRGPYYRLNDSASYVWQISNGTKTIEEICNLVAGEYNINKNQAKKDIAFIINNFRKSKLIKLFKNSKKFYPKVKVYQ